MYLAPRAATRVAALCAVAVTAALAACSGGGTPSAAPTAAATGGGELTGLECSSLQVPLDYANPGGRKVTLTLSMVPATAPRSQQQGVLLVNPGGPGVPGRSFAEQVAAGVSPKVAAEYNIVGFDP